LRTDTTRARAVLLLFFLSGATGLLYQVVWVRLFGHLFGATVLAVSTVLAAFMGGLAAGGLWGGRIAGRLERPLRTYGFLELGLAFWAALVPLLLRATDPFWIAIYPALEGSAGPLTLVRFVVSLLVLLPPTFLMGATLPLLVADADRTGGDARRRVAHLYATNTFGAVAGTAVASFVLLPSLGLARTLVTGITLNVTVALLALALGRRRVGTAVSAASPAPDVALEPAAVPRRLLLGTASALGFAALAFEVLWTRTLSLALGTTTYAFAIVLTVFLVGIASGSAIASRLLRDPARALRVFRWAPAAIGIGAIALLPVFDRLPGLFVSLSARGGGTWLESLLVKFLLAALPLLPPTLLSGAAFPLAVGIDRAAGGASRSVGDIYAANTIGAILGAWAAGFLLIPAVGLRSGIAVAATLPILATCLMLLVRRDVRAGRARAAAAVLAAGTGLLFFALPDWNRVALTRGGFAAGIDLRRTGRDAIPADRTELLFLEEGITTTVTVRRWRDEISMQMNGVTEASNTGDLATQVLVGVLPTMLHPAPRDVVVLGLGSGITAAAAAGRPEVERIVCVEISQAVVDGAKFFTEVNGGIMQDPRFELVVADGRDHLRLSRDTWDCIVSEPSNAWNAGIGALMTREFFATCRARLNPGGVVGSWVHGYSLSADALRSVLAAARAAFPRVSLWSTAWGDFLIIAGDESLTFDVEQMLRLGREPEVGRLLTQGDTPDALTLLSHAILAGDELDRWLGDFPPNSDDNLFLEFEAPRLLYRDTMPTLFEELHRVSGGIQGLVTNAPPGFLERLPDAERARALESRARLAFRDQRGADGVAALEEAIRLLPGAPELHRLLARALSTRGLATANAGDPGTAARDFIRAAEADPAYGEPLAHLARLYRDAGQLDPAWSAAAEAVRREPRQPEILAAAADLRMRRQEAEEARDLARRALEIDPDLVAALVPLGEALDSLGETGLADSIWAEAAARDEEAATRARRRRR
jgi:spermidine synthase